MALTITDTPKIGDAVNRVVMPRFLVRANQQCTYFMGTLPGEVRHHGGSDVAYWRRYDQLSPSTSALSELTTTASYMMGCSAVQPSVTTVTKQVLKYGQFFIVNEETDLQNPAGQEMEFIDVLGQAAGRSANRLVRNEMEDFATTIYAGNQTADGSVVSKLTRNDLRNAINTLEKQTAMKFTPMTRGDNRFNTSPVWAAFWVQAHPDVCEDIRDMSGFVDATAYAGQVELGPNEVGALRGARVICTEEASARANEGGSVGTTGLRSTGGSSIDLYDTVIYGRQAVGTLGFGVEHTDSAFAASDSFNQRAFQLIHHKRGSAGTSDPFDEVDTLAYKFWNAAKILNTNWIRAITSGATDLV